MLKASGPADNIDPRAFCMLHSFQADVEQCSFTCTLSSFSATTQQLGSVAVSQHTERFIGWHAMPARIILLTVLLQI